MTDTTNQAAALLPCPFCGCKTVGIANERHDHSGGYYIGCPQCDASTGLRYACGEDPRPLLVEAWNKRSASQPAGTEQEAGESPPMAQGIVMETLAAARDENVAEEDAYLIDRLSKLLAGVAVALNGPEPERTRWSYHDLPEKAQILVLERDLLKAQAEELRAALPAQAEPEHAPDTSQDWARLDGSAAFHLIERHADDWSDARNMMESWGKARFAAPVPQAAEQATGQQDAQAIREKALEDAAAACEQRADEHKYGPMWNSRKGEEADACADAIRALAGSQQEGNGNE